MYVILGFAPVFQSTPPRGGRHVVAAGTNVVFAVSIHAPARGATSGKRCHLRFRSCFNPRPRAGGDVTAQESWILLDSFNPRPRAGGDSSSAHQHAQQKVSIHAPARGATRLRWTVSHFFPGFNPRPRAGGDKKKKEGGGYMAVSIHAPARGATFLPWPGVATYCCFNPRPRAGGDTTGQATPGNTARFNPRPRAGGDSTCKIFR